MADPIRAAAERLLQQLKLPSGTPYAGQLLEQAESELRLALAAAPPAPDPREALAARPLLEAVARMADRIGQHTVGEITVISDRAAAWLAENPPGQPVAIEPRGCPAPGACSCVEPPAPVPVSDRPWEREGWCDAEGECWWRDRRDPAWWTKADPRMVYDGWLLPHWAIPQPPQGEEVAK